MLEILPESDENTLIVKASSVLTSDDYEKTFIPELNHRISQSGRIKVVMIFSEDFTGWETGAAWDDLVFGIQHRNDFEKIAIVGKQKWLEWATKIGAYFMPNQIKIFKPEELQKAISWVKH